MVNIHVTVNNGQCRDGQLIKIIVINKLIS